MTDTEPGDDDGDDDERWWVEEYDPVTDDPPEGNHDPIEDAGEPQIVDTE